MSKKSEAPSTSNEFNKVYQSSIAHWVWSDVRIPKEVKALVKTQQPKTSLELGCGLGRFSRFMGDQGIQATGVDFASVAIEKAKLMAAHDAHPPTFLVGDVTNLAMLTEPFDLSIDVGCFHCLNESAHEKYASELFRLLKPGATHLLWGLDRSPSNLRLNSAYIAKVFQGRFQLAEAKFSRRRVIGSHWYWLVRG